MEITMQSVVSGKVRTRELDITDEQYNNWQNGMLIQNAMPHLSPEDREFLISGATTEEWDSISMEDVMNFFEENMED